MRIVEHIESRYPNFSGLNLSYEVLEGLRKHDGGFVRPAKSGGEERFENPSLEAQIANRADEITYYSHDLDDGLDYELISESQLEGIGVWAECAEKVRRDFPGLTGKRFRGYVIRVLIDHEVEDLVATTAQNLERANATSSDAVRSHRAPVVAYSDTLRRQNAELRKFLYQNLYFHEGVAEPNARGCRLIEDVFAYYLDHPERLGERTTERLEGDGLYRTVCDYVSGMTDRYLIDEARRIAGRR